MISEHIQPSNKFLSQHTFLTFSLLILALGSVAFGISYLVRGLQFDLLMLILLAALLFSWLLARTKLRGSVAGLLLIALGAPLIFIWVGDLWGPLITWLRTSNGIIWRVLFSSGGLSADTSAYWASLSEIKLRSITLLADLDLWLRSIIAGQPVYTYDAITLIWGYMIWLVSAWAGWFQRRKEEPFKAIFPAGSLLAVSLGYTYGATTALFPLIFAVLTLSGLTFYLKRERSWKTRSMDYPEEERSENILLIFGITLGFVVAAALIPRISIRWVVETIQEWVQPQVEQIDPLFDSFGLKQDLTSLGSMGTAIEGGLPREHLIGSGPELSDQIVMSVQLADSSSSAEELLNLAVPLYWRGLTYDRYTGHVWQSSDVVLRTYQAEEQANQPADKIYRTLVQDFRFVDSNDFIYAAGEIVSLDTNFKIAWRIVPGITETLKTPGDFFAGSQTKSAYRVESMIPVVSEAELRATQDLYPSWISERYLALPDHLPQRVIDLARELTRNSPTSFDKALAIETYLRTYKYELNLPAPPENRELSDYFLFGLQKGYCDYYATTMVVLARAVGIPARIAIGYTRGNYDTANQQFIVAEDNAHSWVEIYFTGIGWIPFEPTAAQAAIERPDRPVNLPPKMDLPLELEAQDFFMDGLPGRWWYWLGGILLAAVFLPLTWLYLDGWYMRWLAPSKMVTKLFQRLYRFGHWVGSPAMMADTPSEFSTILGAQIRAISQDSRWEPYLQAAADDVQGLSQTYVRSIYSSHPLPQDEIRQTISSWQRLRYRLLLVKILYMRRYRTRG